MKTIIKLIGVLILLGLATMTFAQDEPTISVPCEIGQGFRWKDYHNPQLYMTFVQAAPTYMTGNGIWEFSAIARTVICDGQTDYYVGNGVSFKVYEPRSKSFNLQLQGSALFGTRERKLFGGGVKIEKGPFYLVLNARQEYEFKELYVDGGFGFNPFK
jgi:hypothetical protein